MTYLRRLLFIGLITVIAGAIALPKSLEVTLPGGRKLELGSPTINTTILGRPVFQDFQFKRGLDIQGGMQVVLQADMSGIKTEDREQALQSAREIILRRVDFYGISEPVVQTAQNGDDYRLIIELPGVDNPTEALQLVGQTAQLEFQLISQAPAVATQSAETLSEGADQEIILQAVGLSGAQLDRSSVQFDPTTGAPNILMEFNEEGRQIFSQVTTEHTGEMLGIFIDGGLLMAPTINQPIIDGMATITGEFTLDEAQQLSIQLNAGALPIPITVLEQRTIGASLGAQSVQQSVRAGFVGLGLVVVFMILYYGIKGLLASLALIIYALLTLAIYKVLGITVSLPGIAGLLLSIGMAVDANILIFERMKEELRLGKPFDRALELGFGRAWDSIRDANLATIMTALVLVNPLNLSFLNTSGAVRGFGVTLLIGVVISLVTGVFVTRSFLEIFLKDSTKKDTKLFGKK
jgi:preprotein translocase subunit SecD